MYLKVYSLFFPTESLGHIWDIYMHMLCFYASSFFQTIIKNDAQINLIRITEKILTHYFRHV